MTLSTDPNRTSSSAFNVPVAVQTAGTDSFDEVDNPRFAVNEAIKNYNFAVGGIKIFPRLYVLFLTHYIIRGIENGLLQGTIPLTNIASVVAIQGSSWPTTSTSRPRGPAKSGSKSFARKSEHITADVENVLAISD